MRKRVVLTTRMCVGLIVVMLSASCQSASSHQEAGRSVATVGPPVYLDEVIPPCVPLGDTNGDPCAPGPVAPVGPGSSGLAVTPLVIDEAPTVAEIMLGKSTVYSDNLSPGLIKHIVIRGTVNTGTARCLDYYLRTANYIVSNSEGLIHIYCFADVRVNEYLVGEGPPELTVGLHLEVTAFSDWEGYLDREETIAFYGGEDVWIANKFNDPASRTAQAYEGKELVLFLGLPFTVTLEAFVVKTSAFTVWFVQTDEDGTVRAVAEDIGLIRVAENRPRVDIPLAELESQIAEAAVNRTAVTGGRIGTDASLPLLISDANDLRTHYNAIGAVYVTTESPEDDYENVTFAPPPSPGDGDPVQPPITTGEENDGSSGTVPAPGDGDLPDNGGGGTVP